MKRFFIFMLICNLLSIFSNSFGMNPDAQPRENTKDVLEEITGYNKINDSLKAQIVKNRIKNANPDNLSKIIKLTAAAMHDINAPAFFAIFNDPSCVEKIGNWCDKHDNNFLHLSICYVKDRFIDKTIKMIVDIYPNFINHCNNQKRTGEPGIASSVLPRLACLWWFAANLDATCWEGCKSHASCCVIYSCEPPSVASPPPAPIDLFSVPAP